MLANRNSNRWGQFWFLKCGNFVMVYTWLNPRLLFETISALLSGVLLSSLRFLLFTERLEHPLALIFHDDAPILMRSVWLWGRDGSRVILDYRFWGSLFNTMVDTTRRKRLQPAFGMARLDGAWNHVAEVYKIQSLQSTWEQFSINPFLSWRAHWKWPAVAWKAPTADVTILSIQKVSGF